MINLKTLNRMTGWIDDAALRPPFSNICHIRMAGVGNGQGVGGGGGGEG